MGVPHVLIEARTHVHRHLDPRVTAVSDANPFGINLIHVNADQVHAFREQRGPGFFQDRRNIGVWFWEVEPFPSRWPDAFRALDEICKPDAVLASNTSAIPITRIAAATSRPESVVGTHFFSPVPMMQLCELVRGYKTSDETLARARATASPPTPSRSSSTSTS